MMKKSDITALMKDLQKKAHGDVELYEVVEKIDEIISTLDSLEEEEPRIRLPYVNTSTIGTGTWK